jgi:hypothetical protein
VVLKLNANWSSVFSFSHFSVLVSFPGVPFANIISILNLQLDPSQAKTKQMFFFFLYDMLYFTELSEPFSPIICNKIGLKMFEFVYYSITYAFDILCGTFDILCSTLYKYSTFIW